MDTRPDSSVLGGQAWSQICLCPGFATYRLQDLGQVILTPAYFSTNWWRYYKDEVEDGWEYCSFSPPPSWWVPSAMDNNGSRGPLSLSLGRVRAFRRDDVSGRERWGKAFPHPLLHPMAPCSRKSPGPGEGCGLLRSLRVDKSGRWNRPGMRGA